MNVVSNKPGTMYNKAGCAASKIFITAIVVTKPSAYPNATAQKYIGGGFEREDLNRDSPGPAANYDAAPSSLGTQRTSKYNTAPAYKWAPSRNLKPGEDVNLMNARVAKADRNGVVLFARKPLDTPGPGAYF